MPNTYSKYVLEIACFDLKSCLIAQKAGADRIEFCFDYNVGGITPKQSDIIEARKLVRIPLHIIIRPRRENFVYSLKEIEIMENDILFCKQHNIDGVVFGVLNFDATINLNVNKKLVELSKPMSVTFHRAIDECNDIEKSMKEIIALGFDNVLTSGGKQTALQGIETLKNCQKKFGDKINIIAGGGIRSKTIKLIAKETKCKQFHSAAIINNGGLADALEIKQLKQT